MVVNTLPLVCVLARSLTSKILCATSAFHFTWSMYQMPHLCLAITFRLSIWPSCLSANSSASHTYLTITALGNPKLREFSSFYIWMETRTQPILWPRVAHITPGSTLLSLSCSGVIWISSKSELLKRGAKTGHQHPIYINPRALLRRKKLTCGIS